MHGLMFTLILGVQVVVAQFEPYFKPNRSVIVQLFEWKFTDVARECGEFLGPRGFGGVQVSPVSENVIRKDFGRPWWERYHPISYKIVTRSGGRGEFLAMTRACNAAGVRVYVDVVLNQMAAPRLDGNGMQGEEGVVREEEAYRMVMRGTGGSTANASVRDYPAVPFRGEHFHRRCAISDYSNGYQIRICELRQLPDIDHSQEYTRGKIIEFLNDLVELGAAGFRVDAVKYIWPWDLNVIMSGVKDLNVEFDFPKGARPFVLQEVVDLENQAISKMEYVSYGVVTESLYPIRIAAVFTGHKPLSSLLDWPPAKDGFLPTNTLVFVDTYYTQRGRGVGNNGIVLTYKHARNYTMAVAFMLAHPYGIKRIMSSFRFASNDQGPPTLDGDEDDTIASPDFSHDGQCVGDHGDTNASPWVCEHRWNAIANMVAFANYVEGEPISHFQTFGPNQVAFCRGQKGLLVLNHDSEMDLQTSVYACVEAGDYCDAISGGLDNTTCSGRRITVNEQRVAEVVLPADGEFGALAIYGGFRIVE